MLSNISTSTIASVSMRLVTLRLEIPLCCWRIRSYGSRTVNTFLCHPAYSNISHWNEGALTSICISVRRQVVWGGRRGRRLIMTNDVPAGRQNIDLLRWCRSWPWYDCVVRQTRKSGETRKTRKDHRRQKNNDLKMTVGRDIKLCFPWT
jgi:hypothetical protein